MEIINSFVSWIVKKRLHQIELFVKYPHEVQQELLKRLLSTAEKTEWGIKYDYASIANIGQYKERVPLQDYESLKPYIIQLKHGKQNLLWPSEIKWFAKSSGTTSDKSKFIPVSKEALEECHFKGGKDLISIYHSNYTAVKAFTGKGLVIGGSQQINQFSGDSYYGDLSAILIKNLPFWAEFRRIPNMSITLMDKWEEKIEKIAKATIGRNVNNLAGVPSWMLVLLKRVLEISGKSNILEVWPELELYTHGGMSFTPYKEQYKQLIPSSAMNYLETYNASEGFFAIQDQPNAEDMLLMLDYGIYYEFIPIKELQKEQPKTLALEEVEIEKNYALIISTNAGLWRYMIGDTIKFTSLHPYRIKITGRTKQFINTFGEELIVDNAEQGLTIACEKTGALIKEYTVAPIYMDEQNSGAHEWVIEFEKQPNDFDYFRETLDNALKSLNSDYEAKRYKNMVLKEPVINNVVQGTFYAWMKNKGKLGGQNKVPRLSNERQYVEGIMKIKIH